MTLLLNCFVPLLLIYRQKHSLFCFFSIPDSVKPEPTILAQRKVYIQWRKGKKLHLIVGGYAYLLPWTTVVLRCPTRHFRKGHIQWLKEGKPLVSQPHLSITSLGYVKIQQVRPSDAGVFTCVAGPAQEHFVLQIIGSKQKLSVPESWLLRNGQQKLGQSDMTSVGERFHELPISLNRYDGIVERLLGFKGSLQVEKEGADKTHSGEKNRSTLEDENSDLSSLVVLTADTHRLDEIMHSLSESHGGARTEQLIAQLLSELTMSRGETNESTLHPPENAESSTQGPPLYKPNIKAHTSRPRTPVIIQRSRKFGMMPASDMVFHVGVPVLLQKHVSSLELRCEALGSPEPSLTWTKNRKQLHYSSR